MIHIETERLILRDLIDTDAQGMFSMDADPKVHLYLGNSPVSSIDQSKADINFIREQYKSNGIGRWAVVDKLTGDFLGWSGLKLMRARDNGQINYYDLGYRFLSKYWGKGYATESARAAVEYGFLKLGLPEIIAIADTRNLGSIHVLEKVGLTKVNIFDYQNRPHPWMNIKK